MLTRAPGCYERYVIYRDDQEAMQQRLEGTSREAERLRKENESMRAAVGRMPINNPNTTLVLPPGAVYGLLDVRTLPLEERARLAVHTLRPFPVWLVGLLNLLTAGLFPFIHFGLLHDRLPRASHNDPSAGQAIGYQFIPFYNLYWTFFNALRLCDRLTLQLRLRGLPERAPRGIVLAACIVGVIPYMSLVIGIPILWTISVCMLQSTVNRVARLSPTQWDATQASLPPAYPANPAYPQSPANAAYPPLAANAGHLPPMAMFQPSPEQLAQQDRARKLVNLSHVLGWGGLGVLLIGTAAVGVVAGAAGAAAVGVGATISMVVGAIIGQVGRGMQGRAI